MTRPPETITCVECGGTCHLLADLDEDRAEELQPGDVLVYRCDRCGERFDLVYEADEDDPPPATIT